MSTVFFIGDTHFCHKNILNFESTKPFRQFTNIEEHDEELVKRWNGAVSKHDTVWHLGDVCFGSRKNLEICGRLNGNKKLVMGNHDAYPTSHYLRYFSQVYGAIAWNKFLLTHVPVHQNQFGRMEMGKGNIHGHLHSGRIQKTHWVGLGDGIEVDDPRYICVSAEQINLTPMAFDDLKKWKNLS